MFLQCGGGGVGGKRQLPVGVKTALAFHRSEPPPSSSRTGWIMHEYRLAVPRGVAEQRKKNASQVRIPTIISTIRLQSFSVFAVKFYRVPDFILCRKYSQLGVAHTTPNLLL